jgi:hypothetical protein
MKSKEKDIVYGRKYIKFLRGGRTHELFSKGICCFIELTVYHIEKYKGSIFDPNVDFNGVDCVQKKHLDMMHSKLSDLDDTISMAFNLYCPDDCAELNEKRKRWMQRYNEVAKEFARVNKTKVKVLKLWWQD